MLTGMVDQREGSLEPVFIALDLAEVDLAETLLEKEGIVYSVRPEHARGPTLSRVCYQGLLFEVPAGRAAFCRQLFTERGLKGGVVAAEGFISTAGEEALPGIG